MSLRITRACDYAIRAMLHLASMPDGAVALSDEIARTESIPPSFAAKVLRRLARSGLLVSTRGIHGGYKLARIGSDINLLDVVEAMEGPIEIADCATDVTNCTGSDNCPAGWVWVAIQRDLAGRLRAATLERLVSLPRKNRWPDGEELFDVEHDEAAQKSSLPS